MENCMIGQIQFNGNNPELLKNLMASYGNCNYPFFGKNANGESVSISIFPDKIVYVTFQGNGWIRKNYYDENGYPNGETYEK